MTTDSSSELPRLPRRDHRSSQEALDRLAEALRGLRYGQVTVTVQDGVIVQVERTDKVRLPSGEHGW